jgi:hypothetical protein
MILLVLAFVGGILTIVSPCILPVLPFVFARADRPFRKSGLPLLFGMALTFAALRVKLEGKEPGIDHGVDTGEQGNGKITGHCLYQLIRQKGAIDDRTFEIEFLDPGAQAFAITFG